jgi:hypothetical protein
VCSLTISQCTVRDVSIVSSPTNALRNRYYHMSTCLFIRHSDKPFIQPGAQPQPSSTVTHKEPVHHCLTTPLCKNTTSTDVINTWSKKRSLEICVRVYQGCRSTTSAPFKANASHILHIWYPCAFSVGRRALAR